MPRLPPERYTGTPIDLDCEPFDEAQVNGVLAAVGDAFPLLMEKEQFQERLNSIALLHAHVLSSNTEPTLTAEQNYLLDLRWAVRQLAALVPLEAVPDDEEGRFPREPPHGVLRLLDVPMAELIEQRLSEERAAWIERQKRSEVAPSARRPSPPALSATDIFGGETPTDILTVASEVARLLDHATTLALPPKQQKRQRLGRPAVFGKIALPLMKLYHDAFGQEPGVSRSGGEKDVSGPMVLFIEAVCLVMGIKVSGEAIAKAKAEHFSKKQKASNGR
jgi:hypothetical protein